MWTAEHERLALNIVKAVLSCSMKGLNVQVQV